MAIAKAAAEKVKVGDPRDPRTTDRARWSARRSSTRSRRLIEHGHRRGRDAGRAAARAGPRTSTAATTCGPTVFADVTNDMTIAREEIFGPVLSMLTYDTEDEAIAIANDTVYGLAGYVQSGDIDHARKVAAQLRAGNVHLNGAPATSQRPFGGYKQSGNGRE